MIIKNSAIQLNNQHQLIKKFQESESFRFWKTEQQPADRNRSAEKSSQADSVSLSKSTQTHKPEKQTLDLSEAPNSEHGVMLLIIKQLVMKLTGKDFKLFSADELATKLEQTEAIDTQNVEITMSQPWQQPFDPDFGLVYEYRSSYRESESLSFSATGQIQTKDGQSIDFTVQLNMSREFRIETNLSIAAGAPEKKVDPLVINFDGNAAELSQTRFEFDIDANGISEQIALLKPGSGFLALDKNKDNVINNGSELFGPKSGNGFSELAAYDVDGNRFIDEADPVYDRLRIWQRHEDGSQQLIALGDKNIGAIYLGHATTPFQLRTAENKSLGEITDTGLYLTEDGKAGTVQQINLSI
jgi:hypothetical protein